MLISTYLRVLKVHMFSCHGYHNTNCAFTPFSFAHLSCSLRPPPPPPPPRYSPYPTPSPMPSSPTFTRRSVWDGSTAAKFNWTYHDATTFSRYSEETSYENSLLVKHRYATYWGKRCVWGYGEVRYSRGWILGFVERVDTGFC